MPRSGVSKRMLANQDDKRYRDANPAKMKLKQKRKTEKLLKRRNEVLKYIWKIFGNDYLNCYLIISEVFIQNKVMIK